MQTAPPTSAQLRSKSHVVTQEALRLCAALDDGQSERPLGGHFRSLSEEVDRIPFGFVLFGLTHDDTSQVLGWLCGRSPGSISLPAPESPGVLEICGEYDPEILDTGIAAPESATAVTRRPAALNRLVEDKCLLMVAAGPDHRLTDDENAAIGEIAPLVGALWPVVVTEEQEIGSRELGQLKWYRDRATKAEILVLPPFCLSTRQPPKFPDLLTDAADPLRQALAFPHHALRLAAAALLVAERHEEECRRLSSKQSVLSRKLKLEDETAKDQSLKIEVERIRAECQDELAKLSSGIGELNRKAMLSSGDLLRSVQEAASRVESDDLEGEARGSTTRLTVHEEALDRLAETTKQALRAKLHEDMIFLNDGLELVEEQVREGLAAFCGEDMSLELAVPDENEIWDVITEMVSIEISYRGEIPKRGFLQRLVEGRRQVYMILMSVSLFGGAFGVSRTSPWVRNLFLVLFLCGVVYTFFSWKREDRYRVEKELDRVKDSLSGEVKRILAEVNREKLSRISAHLNELGREALREIDARVREITARKELENDQSRQELRSRLQSLEQQKRERQPQGQLAAKLNQAAQELERTCQTSLREAIHASS